MEQRGIISGFDGSKARKVLIDEDDLPRVLGRAAAPGDVRSTPAPPAGRRRRREDIAGRLARDGAACGGRRPARSSTRRPRARHAPQNCVLTDPNVDWMVATSSGPAVATSRRQPVGKREEEHPPCSRSAAPCARPGSGARPRSSRSRTTPRSVSSTSRPWRTTTSTSCPRRAYVKGFLRTYSDYLGLDADVMIEEYRSRFEPNEEHEPFGGNSALGKPHGHRAAQHPDLHRRDLPAHHRRALRHRPRQRAAASRPTTAAGHRASAPHPARRRRPAHQHDHGHPGASRCVSWPPAGRCWVQVRTTGIAGARRLSVDHGPGSVARPQDARQPIYVRLGVPATSRSRSTARSAVHAGRDRLEQLRGRQGKAW